MSKGRSAAHGQSGFSLVETLIATAIIAGMTMMAFQTISANAQATRLMIDRRAAVLVAKSALDSAIGSTDMARTGASGALQWRLSVEPYQPRANGAPPLDRVTVIVASAQSGRSVLRLSSLRVGR